MNRDELCDCIEHQIINSCGNNIFAKWRACIRRLRNDFTKICNHLPDDIINVNTITNINIVRENIVLLISRNNHSYRIDIGSTYPFRMPNIYIVTESDYHCRYIMNANYIYATNLGNTFALAKLQKNNHASILVFDIINLIIESLYQITLELIRKSKKMPIKEYCNFIAICLGKNIFEESELMQTFDWITLNWSPAINLYKLLNMTDQLISESEDLLYK